VRGDTKSRAAMSLLASGARCGGHGERSVAPDDVPRAAACRSRTCTSGTLAGLRRGRTARLHVWTRLTVGPLRHVDWIDGTARYHAGCSPTAVACRAGSGCCVCQRKCPRRARANDAGCRTAGMYGWSVAETWWGTSLIRFRRRPRGRGYTSGPCMLARAAAKCRAPIAERPVTNRAAFVAPQDCCAGRACSRCSAPRS
jgi:hypothetical protein